MDCTRSPRDVHIPTREFTWKNFKKHFEEIRILSTMNWCTSLKKLVQFAHNFSHLK